METKYIKTFMPKKNQSCYKCKTPIDQGELYVQEIDDYTPLFTALVSAYCCDCGKKYNKSNRVMLPSEQG